MVVMQAFHYETLDSTNDEAKRLVLSGKLDGPAFVIAREQTAGRGTRGRKWVSPKDAGLYFTVVSFPRGSLSRDTTAYTLASGVACVEALADVAGVEVRLKPINDLLVDRRKLGGILTETILSGPQIQTLTTGVGINIQRADRPLADTNVKAVSLAELVPFAHFAHLDLDRLVATLIARIIKWHRKVATGETEAIHAAWETHKIPGTSLPPTQSDGVPPDKLQAS